MFSSALSSLERAMKSPPDATKSYPLLSSMFVVQAMLGRGVDYSAVPPPSHAGYKRRRLSDDESYRDESETSEEGDTDEEHDRTPSGGSVPPTPDSPPSSGDDQPRKQQRVGD